MSGCSGTKEESFALSGTIHFQDGKTLKFTDMTSLIFILREGTESVPQNVSEWPVLFDPTSVSRSIPLSWVRSIEMVSYETRDLYRCLFNPVVDIESVSGVHIISQYRTLEWVKVKIPQGDNEKEGIRQVYFADSGSYLQSLGESRINIKKIVFDD
jgi:hypothetical protein